MPQRVRSDFPELKAALAAGACALAALSGSAVSAATPTPHPVVTTFKQVIAPPPLPTKPLHSVLTVETNKLGQVVRVRAIDASKDVPFDTMTYGNALQAFIRRPDGTAVAGVYQLIYDYSPQTKKVRRDVRLVRAGGVNPDAPGAVTVELEKDAKRRAAEREKAQQSQKKLPDFDQIVSPSPKPRT